MAEQDNRQQRQFYKKKQEQNPLYQYGGRTLPQDKDLEEAVLGALMLEKDAYTEVCDMIKPETFYER